MKIRYFLGFFVLVVIGMSNVQAALPEADIKAIIAKADGVAKVVGDYVQELGALDKKDPEYDAAVTDVVDRIKVSLNVK